jgi:flagellar protein FliS
MNAQSGVIYLMGTLDMEVGGELATRLRLLYVYLLRRLGEAAVDLDTIAICEAEGIVATLASSWQEAVSRS